MIIAFTPYASYVLDQWQAGVHDGKQLYAEIQALGFAGSIRLVYNFLQTLRENRRPLSEIVPPSPAEQFSARNAVWLFIRPRDAQRDHHLARISLSSGVVHTADLVAMMGRCCSPRDEMNATKRDLEVLR